jgi:VanZ family protein
LIDGKQSETHQLTWTWLVFGIALMILLTWINGRRRWFVFLFMMAFAAFDELRQLFLPGRSASIGDFATDLLVITAILWVVLPRLLHSWGRR